MMLTIVCPAFGRPAFTRRFVDHACKLPFLLELDEGERLPAQEYFVKVRDAVHRVNTPYAMLADNDDLPTQFVGRCCSFLDNQPEYVCCSGRIQGFHMWPDKVAGPHTAVTGQYAPYDTPVDYDQHDISDRVLAGFANSWSYYGVYRTEALRQIWHEVCELNLTNLQVHEKFCAMRTLTLGRARCLPFFTSIYRQLGTSQGAQWQSSGGHDMLKVLDLMEREGVERDKLTGLWLDWYDTRSRYFRSPIRKAITKIVQSRWLSREGLPA